MCMLQLEELMTNLVDVELHDAYPLVLPKCVENPPNFVSALSTLHLWWKFIWWFDECVLFVVLWVAANAEATNKL